MARKRSTPETYASVQLTDATRRGGPPRKRPPPPDTPFTRWLSTCGMVTGEIAEALEISIPYLYKLRDGDRAPGRDVAIRIRDLSNGEVPVESWPETTRAKG